MKKMFVLMLTLVVLCTAVAPSLLAEDPTGFDAEFYFNSFL